MITIDEARGKLEEFPHWRNISGLVGFNYSDGYFITLDTESDQNAKEAPVSVLHAQAIKEVLAILEGINSIDSMVSRAYLISYYLSPPNKISIPILKIKKTRPVYSEFKKVMGIKGRVTKTMVEQEALSYFADHYTPIVVGS